MKVNWVRGEGGKPGRAIVVEICESIFASVNDDNNNNKSVFIADANLPTFKSDHISYADIVAICYPYVPQVPACNGHNQLQPQYALRPTAHLLITADDE